MNGEPMASGGTSPAGGGQGGLGEQMSRLGQEATERLKVTKDKAVELGGQVRDSASEYLQQARSSAEQYLRQGQVFIRANPTKGLLYALGAGFVIGWLLKR
jgi:ElaB/YqjD/DUF883 family membrane-anchored ribosome-binding protein